MTRRLDEWGNDQWSATLESLDPEDQSLWRMTKQVMRVTTLSPPYSPDGKSLSQTPVLFSPYGNDMPPPSHHFELAIYADDTAITATSRKPTLLVSYLESYLNELQRWLDEWKIAINVSKSTAIMFARARRHII